MITSVFQNCEIHVLLMYVASTVIAKIYLVPGHQTNIWYKLLMRRETYFTIAKGMLVGFGCKDEA